MKKPLELVVIGLAAGAAIWTLQTAATVGVLGLQHAAAWGSDALTKIAWRAAAKKVAEEASAVAEEQ